MDTTNVRRNFSNGKAGIRKQQQEKITAESEGEKDKGTRINIRLSKENLAFMKKESRTLGTNVSSLCSVAVGEWIMRKRIDYRKLDNRTDIELFMRDPEFRADLKKYLDSTDK